LLSQGSQKFSETQEGNLFPSYNSKFVSNMLAGESKHPQTFAIILPNLIHKLKAKNLKS